MTTPVAFTWQRHKQPLPDSATAWRRQEKISMAAEAATKHPYAGMSVLDILWQELDDIMDQLMEQGAPEKSSMAKDFETRNNPTEARELREIWYTSLQSWGELRGQAQGVAYAIALVTNPYAADVPAVKAEAKARWDARQD